MKLSYIIDNVHSYNSLHTTSYFSFVPFYVLNSTFCRWTSLLYIQKAKDLEDVDAALNKFCLNCKLHYNIFIKVTKIKLDFTI